MGNKKYAVPLPKTFKKAALFFKRVFTLINLFKVWMGLTMPKLLLYFSRRTFNLYSYTSQHKSKLLYTTEYASCPKLCADIHGKLLVLR